MDELTTLTAKQAGLVARRQLTRIGICWDRVDHQIRARRWVERSPRVISTFTGELTVAQRRWLGVLHAGPRTCWVVSRRPSSSGCASGDRKK